LIYIEVDKRNKEYKMRLILHCIDLGIKCDWVGFADTEEELMEKLRDHAANKHNMGNLTEPQLEEIKKAIRHE
jgi:predicted small metal-binding protein